MNIVQEFAHIGIDIRLREQEVRKICFDVVADDKKEVQALFEQIFSMKAEADPDQSHTDGE